MMNDKPVPPEYLQFHDTFTPDEDGLKLLKERGLIEDYEVHEDGSYSFTPKFPLRKVACCILPETDGE